MGENRLFNPHMQLSRLCKHFAEKTMGSSREERRGVGGVGKVGWREEVASPAFSNRFCHIDCVCVCVFVSLIDGLAN